MKRTYELIPDENVLRVHGAYDFGNMTPREVINEGVFKVSLGYHCGSTQYWILREHKLITKEDQWPSYTKLTRKGQRYAQALYVEGRIRFH